jgi:hypothetical protein
VACQDPPELDCAEPLPAETVGLADEPVDVELFESPLVEVLDVPGVLDVLELPDVPDDVLEVPDEVDDPEVLV